MYSYKHYQYITHKHPFYIIYITWVKLQNVHIFWDTFPGQTDKKRFRVSPTISFPSKSLFRCWNPSKAWYMYENKNIILSSKNDSSILDRQVRDCPDVSEKQFHREYPGDTRRISKGYRRDMTYMKDWSSMCSSRSSGAYVKGIIQRLKLTWD